VILREEPDGSVVCIGQPAHAFLSGQMARLWHPRPEPFEEVCLAAIQHDAGMADWDADPDLNPETGLPLSFMQMPLATHLELWTHAPQRVLPQSRYAAILVSMHGTALYEMRDLSRLEPDEAEAVRAYLAGQRALQDELSEGLDREQLRENQELLWIWDFLSLGLCLRWHGRTVNGITLEEDTIRPWPFVDDEVSLFTEGRRGQDWVRLSFRLSRR
jgi:hypothetical protein